MYRALAAFLALLILSVPGQPLASSAVHQPPDARPPTVLVRMLASDLEAAEARVKPTAAVQNYGRFVWLELANSDLERLAATGLPYEVRPSPYTLRLGAQRFDPVREPSSLPPGWDRLPGDGPDLHLVQFAGPIRDEWLAELRSQGLEVVQYIHPFTYIVWGEPSAIERSATAPAVRWHGPFAPGYRVLPEWRTLDAELVRVDLLLVRVADLKGAQRRLEALGARSQGQAVLNDTFSLMSATLPGAALQAAARVPGVYSIQLEPTDGGLRGEMSSQVNVNNLDEDGLAFPGYQDWLAAVGLDGSGVIIASVDSGLEDSHPDLTKRVLPCIGQSCGGAEKASKHGTHTAGIIAADGSSGIVDERGFLRGLGVAPGASLLEQVFFPWYLQEGGMLLLMTDSVRNGAVVSSNSWGPSGTPKGYDNDTMQVDIGVRDADPETPGNQPLTYIVSLMNGFGGYQTQGTPDEAKNILTIGSTKMQTSEGTQELALDDLSHNTAHGPAWDGRTIPHLVAPGCEVDSTALDGDHERICGTSMAAPQVSGAAALFVQRYRSLEGVDPSPAMIKAAFLAVARDLSGHLDADGNRLGHPFDSKQGWGRLDAEAVVDPQQPVHYYDNPTIFDHTGEEWVHVLQVDPPGQPLCLMLAWTDAPGHGLGGDTPAWNNDLDLLVEAGGEIYRGNNFDIGGLSHPGGIADVKNNTEGVFLRAGTAVSVTIRVLASNIPSDGVPHHGDETDQDFALVCYHCRLPTILYFPLFYR
jgi:hypothetical protein